MSVKGVIDGGTDHKTKNACYDICEVLSEIGTGKR